MAPVSFPLRTMELNILVVRLLEAMKAIRGVRMRFTMMVA